MTCSKFDGDRGKKVAIAIIGNHQDITERPWDLWENMKDINGLPSVEWVHNDTLS